VKASPLAGVSLLWRILISTSLLIALLFLMTGIAIQRYVSNAAERSLQNEVQTSFGAYQSLWTTRTGTLAAVSRVISQMSDVRAAFTTRDRATIRDSAQELWTRIAAKDSFFLVLSPDGQVIADFGGHGGSLNLSGATMYAASRAYPMQASGYLGDNGRLLYVVFTPVYVQAGAGDELLNILLVGFTIDNALAENLKLSTRGSDFLFLLHGGIVAATAPKAEQAALVRPSCDSGKLAKVTAHGIEHLVLATSLPGLDGRPVGELRIVRSLEGAQRAVAGLERNVVLIWLLAAALGLSLTYVLARQLLEPLRRLDKAAYEVAHQNYEYRVPINGAGELKRLATTFNAMCDSIQRAREELICHERISTIGRLTGSIVHDLRNPLAAIYGGAEVLIDSDLPPAQAKRLAATIYRASRRIQEMLQDLVNISRGKTGKSERCKLCEIVSAARDTVAHMAEAQNVRLSVDVPTDLELWVERARVERLFINLMNNALEAMPAGGEISVRVKYEQAAVVVTVDDTGSGLSEEVKAKLFQPFVSQGKKNGLGLGLALSRQTALEHGGDLWAEEKASPGARFCLRLPASRVSQEVAEVPWVASM
jgi:signal transduction histidine kinase